MQFLYNLWRDIRQKAEKSPLRCCSITISGDYRPDQKGARITSHIALPGCYVVYMPSLEHTCRY
jgi:hypothetical protein